jgi:HlyD family secretion protein
MKWGTVVAVGVVVLAVGAGLWWAFSPRPIAVDLAGVEQGDLVLTVKDEGVARIREVYEVSAPVGGQLLRLPVKAGDWVTAGQVVATILPQESALLDARTLAEAEASVRAAEDAVLAAESDLRVAQSEIKYAVSELDRKERLQEKGLATLQQVEQVRLEYARREALVANAEAALEMRQHQLEQARARLADYGQGDTPGAGRDLVAPVAGRILRLVSESSRTIIAGTPLLEIGDPSQLEVVVDLLSADAMRIDVGAEASITGWGGDRNLMAQVALIEPIGFTRVSALGVEEQRVSVHLDFKGPTTEGIYPGHLYRVEAEIETTRFPSATLAPVAALFRNGSDWSVFRVEEGKARLTHIAVEARNAEWAAVSEGLAPGSTVIIHPSDLIADGALVAPR